MFEWLKRKQIHQTGKTGMIAASATITNRDVTTRKMIKPDGWQTLAWRAYHCIPEIKYGVNWKAAGVSRCRLYVGTADIEGAGDPIPTDNDTVNAVMEALYEGFSGQSQMLRRMTQLWEIVGEWHLVGVKIDNEIRWAVTTGSRLIRGDTADLSIQFEPDGERYPLTQDNSTIIWAWNPDPAHELRPDSAVRGTLPVVDQLIKLDSRIDATAESRLAGNGILKISEGITVSNPGLGEGNADTGDEVIEALMDAMLTSIQDRESAAAVVPIVLTAPAGEEGEIEHITLSSPFDSEIQALREACIRRIAVGLDIPAEILTGMAERTSKWTAWLISEDAVKLNIEPVLESFCAALTEQYLRPALRSLGVENVDNYLVWYDSSELVLRPNKGPEARELYREGIISAESARRESGFSEEDAPSPEEQVQRLLSTLVVNNPDLLPQLLPQIQQVIAQHQQPAQIEGTTPAVTSAPTAPTSNSGPATSPAVDGRINTPNSLALVASTRVDIETQIKANGQLYLAETAVLRALERVGNRLMKREGRPYRRTLTHIPQWELHQILHMSDEDCHQILEKAYRILEEVAPDSPCLVQTVDKYVRDLVKRQRPHKTEKLLAALVEAGCVGDERG